MPAPAPTLPEPRPDDYASLLTLAQEAAAAREGQEFGMTFNGIELLNEEQSRAYMLTIRLWNALPPGVVIALIEQARALTPHPAPLGATAITDDDVRRAVCDFNDWKYAEMMSHVSLRDVRSLALRVVLENFASRAALQAGG